MKNSLIFIKLDLITIHYDKELSNLRYIRVPRKIKIKNKCHSLRYLDGFWDIVCDVSIRSWREEWD